MVPAFSSRPIEEKQSLGSFHVASTTQDHDGSRDEPKNEQGRHGREHEGGERFVPVKPCQEPKHEPPDDKYGNPATTSPPFNR